MSDGVGVLLIA